MANQVYVKLLDGRMGIMDKKLKCDTNYKMVCLTTGGQFQPMHHSKLLKFKGEIKEFRDI